MKRVLLVGAGFSRTWGGWLANEVMGELCGRLKDRPHLVEMLRKMPSFEVVFGTRQETALSEPGNEQAHVDVRRLSQAITDTFADMNEVFAALPNMELSSLRDRSICDYLAQFDSVYSLNQDLLLELHYLASSAGQQSYLPGIDTRPWRDASRGKEHRAKLSVADGLALNELGQPVVKLHGSTNWIDGMKQVMVIGTGKEAAIGEARLLRWYHELFRADLTAGGTRLMVIGYGFLDGHINRLLVEAAAADLKMYLVDPLGLRVFDFEPNNELQKVRRGLTGVPLIGLSVRPLEETFGDGPGSMATFVPRGENLSLRSFRRFFE